MAGGTIDSFGLDVLGANSEHGITARVPKEKILADVQFQGAISDWHPIKPKVQAADYDPILVRLNDDDLYGDGNNYEVSPAPFGL
jgi:hypothetical protein